MPAKASPVPHGGRILVVEDNVLFRFMVAEHLRRLGFTVDDVSTADEARQAITRSGVRYNLVVADIHLPDSTGIDFARVAHELRPDLPFVFITGDDDESLARRALLEDPAGYLIKPFELTELDAVVLHTVQASSNSPRQSPAERVKGMAKAGSPYPILMLKSPRDEADRRAMMALYLKLAAAVSTILLMAFLLGHFLGPDAPRPLDADAAPGVSR
jgi:CheY-like chemotaxis protein